MKRVFRLLVALAVAVMMTVPSFASVSGLDIPEGWMVDNDTLDCYYNLSQKPVAGCNVATLMKEESGDIFEMVYLMKTIEGNNQEIDREDPKAVEKAYFNFAGYGKQAVSRNTGVPLYMNQLGEEDAEQEYQVVPDKNGKYMLQGKLNNEDGEHIVFLISPLGTELMRIITITDYSGKDMEDILEAAVSFQDDEKVLEEAKAGMMEATEKVKETSGYEGLGKKKNLLVLFGLALILIIFVVVKAILKVRFSKKGEFKEYDPVKEGKVPVELTCAMCKNKFTVYAKPEEIELIRKNSNRCPECTKKFKDEMGWSAKHIMWWR